MNTQRTPQTNLLGNTAAEELHVFTFELAKYLNLFAQLKENGGQFKKKKKEIAQIADQVHRIYNIGFTKRPPVPADPTAVCLAAAAPVGPVLTNRGKCFVLKPRWENKKHRALFKKTTKPARRDNLNVSYRSGNVTTFLFLCYNYNVHFLQISLRHNTAQTQTQLF